MFSGSDNESIGASEDDVQLTINEHYAKAFNYRKEREEYEKLKEKYGSDIDEEDGLSEESTDSESAESEDEDGEELTPAVDAAILRTLARIRKKDPAIYDSSKSIFGEEEKTVKESSGNRLIKSSQSKKDKSKPVTIRQANLDAVLHDSRSPSPSTIHERQEHQPTHVEEQRALRQETIAAFHNAVSDEEAEGDLLVLREKTKDEVEAEEEAYRAYLERHVGEDLGKLIGVKDFKEVRANEAEDKKTAKKLKKKKKEKEEKTKEEKDQEFLLDYILNRGWIDASSKRVPTYTEVTSNSKAKKARPTAASFLSDSTSDEVDVNEQDGGHDGEDPGLLSDTSFTSLADIFETSYNHRYEEPNASTIPSYPRQIASTVRREDSKRKDARERRKARKEEEMRIKKEEVRRMKALKMKEVKRRLERIGRESGLLATSGPKGKKGREDEAYGGDDEEEGLDVQAALRELDLEGEWDPEKHDQQMEGLFSGEQDEGEGEEGEVTFDKDGKPIWDDDIDIGDIYVEEDDSHPGEASSSKKDKKKKKKKKKKGGEEEQEEGVDIEMMDADAIVQARGDKDEEEWDGTEEMRKRKWNEYMAELDEMDFNDVVGGLATRFKYVPIPTQSYSLDPVEILLADDKDLNEYMSIKKYAPYRNDLNKGDRARWDPKQREKLNEFKKRVQEREREFFGSTISGDGRGESRSRHSEAGEEKKPKPRKGRKERARLKVEAGASKEEGSEEMKKQLTIVEPVKEKKKKRIRNEEDENTMEAQEDANSQKKRRRRHGKKDVMEHP